MSRNLHKSLNEWSRCSEGFGDEPSCTSNGQKKVAVKRKSTDTSFNHGNIFEKLFGVGGDASSQSIAWSSSDSDVESKPGPEKKTENTSKPSSTTKPKPSSTIKSKPTLTNLKAASTTKPKQPSSTSKTLSSTKPPVNKKQRRQSSPRSAISAITASIKKHLNHEELEIHGESDTEVTNDQADTQVSASAINGFDSDNDVEIIQTPKQVTPEKEESQVSICVVDSSSSTSPVTQVGTGLKASEWVKSLQLKTPCKSSQNDSVTGEEGLEESAKKKKKQCRGGLAEQLSRLQSRDKSSVRMWSHQQTKSLSQDSKSLSMEVISHETLYSLQLVRCVTVSIPELGTKSPDPIIPGPSSSDTGNQREETRLVMFPASQIEQLGLQIGTRFKIFPPWQQLELNDGQQILLCTKYCHVLEQPSSKRKSEPPTVIDDKPVCRVSVKAKWNCPCIQGLCGSASQCAAYKFPAVAGLVQDSTAANKPSGKDSNSNLLKWQKPSTSSHLHTISANSGKLRGGQSATKDVNNTNSTSGLNAGSVCDSLLRSIEQRGLGADNPVVIDLDHPVVSFRAHVHRHVITSDKNGSKRHCLFVEDSQGTVCQILLKEETVLREAVNMADTETRTFQFSGLIVQVRVTRDRDASLFSMVDCVWSGHSSVESQDSAQSHVLSGDADHVAQPQSYCYILYGTGSGHTVSIQPTSHHIIQHKPPPYTPLLDLNTLLKPCRCTCLVRLLYIHKQFGKTGSYVLYVTDTSIQASSRYIRVPMSRDFTAQLSSFHTSGCTIIELRDLFIQQADVSVKADCYSRLTVRHSAQDNTAINSPPDNHNQRTIQELKSISVILKPFGSTLTQDDLCFIKGVILEVDEDTAYSWETCIHCASDQVQSAATQNNYQCLSCKQYMAQAVTKMKMEVIITCETSQHRAKVDLLQSTIESLLPADEDEDDEGYDMSCVLNKQVGPLQCLVTAIETKHLVLQEITLLQ